MKSTETRAHKPSRIEIFLAVHSLNRGRVGCYVAICGAWFYFQPLQREWCLLPAVLFGLHLYQMHRGFVRYAEEVLFQFL